jgi:diguanylate cyclase (GGDEF)-like protein
VTDWDDITNIISDAEMMLDGEERTRAYLVVQVGASVGELYRITREATLGRSRRADFQLIDDGVSRRHARIIIEGDEVFLEDLNSRNGTFIGSERLTGRRKLENGDRIALAGGKVVLRFTVGDSLDEEFQRQMYNSSLRDGLTMAFNKRYFTERLNSEYRFAERHSEPLSLLLLDLDEFKQINDQNGHVAGDHVLKKFAAAMIQSVRNEDVFARYGGEEFCVISRAIALDQAQTFAERLRAVTEGLDIEFGGKKIPLTVSIGIATLPESGAAGPTELLNAADRALYAAKSRGRNRVVLYSPTLEVEETRP